MSDNFSAEFFVGNRRRLRELFTGTAPIVITANGQLQKGGDATFPFQQDASFWYLTGIDEPDIVLVMDKDKEYLIVPELSDYQTIFDGTVTANKLSERSGILHVVDGKEGWKLLAGRLKKVKHVATLAANPAYVPTYGMYTNPSRRTLIKRMKAENPDLEFLDVREHLARLRMSKQPAEIQTMRQAINLTATALQQLQKKISKFSREYEVEAFISSYVVSRGAKDAWKPIVAAGPNSCILHSRDNLSEMHATDVVVVDVGAEIEHYCADLTRTWSLGGEPTKRQQKVFDAVAEVQDFAFQLQKPGVSLRENEQRVEEFMGEKLRALGLIKTIEHETVRKYFPHATSHFLGLDPHDAGDYDQPLEPGMVLTVEPGIYIPEEGIGVRIEDDILITADCYENLSARLARRLW